MLATAEFFDTHGKALDTKYETHFSPGDWPRARPLGMTAHEPSPTADAPLRCLGSRLRAEGANECVWGSGEAYAPKATQYRSTGMQVSIGGGSIRVIDEGRIRGHGQQAPCLICVSVFAVSLPWTITL